MTADLNFQQVERTSETYDPNAPSIRSEERTKTNNSDTDKAEAAKRRTKQENIRDDRHQLRNQQDSRTYHQRRRHHSAAFGGGDGRRHLSDQVEDAGGVTGDESTSRAPQEELDRLARSSGTAVGFNPQRNDQIEMFNMPFDRQELSPIDRALDTMYQREFYCGYRQEGRLVLLALLVLLYLKRKSRKLFKSLGESVRRPASDSQPSARPSAR